MKCYSNKLIELNQYFSFILVSKSIKRFTQELHFHSSVHRAHHSVYKLIICFCTFCFHYRSVNILNDKFRLKIISNGTNESSKFTWFYRIGYIDIGIVTVIFRSGSRFVDDHISKKRFAFQHFTGKIDSTKHTKLT